MASYIGTFMHTTRKAVCANPLKDFSPSKPFSVHRNIICHSNIERALIGEDFGARDPTAGEIETGFGEKSFFNWNTEHLIKPPDTIKKILGLTARQFTEGDSLSLLSEDEVALLHNQVPGWKMISNESGITCIRQEWTAKDADSAQKIANILQELSASNKHEFRVNVNGNTVTAEATTLSRGGLTENDFIIAAKVNDLKLTDLLQKRRPRYWA